MNWGHQPHIPTSHIPTIAWMPFLVGRWRFQPSGTIPDSHSFAKPLRPQPPLCRARAGRAGQGRAGRAGAGARRHACPNPPSSASAPTRPFCSAAPASSRVPRLPPAFSQPHVSIGPNPKRGEMSVLRGPGKAASLSCVTRHKSRSHISWRVAGPGRGGRVGPRGGGGPSPFPMPPISPPLQAFSRLFLVEMYACVNNHTLGRPCPVAWMG